MPEAPADAATRRATPSCRTVVSTLGDYVDGDLDTADRLALGRHLDRCDPCAAYLESYRDCERLLRWAFGGEPDC